ncbi:LLM class flavin-dependent oxidoreductase [Pseudonocardia xishanensis]|uniref:Luciferase-like domain-containing protein n=1 Tax=Pseudonocardia xishanensis TaxID=630995 RepID=A0ABP8RDF2_9PSEU
MTELEFGFAVLPGRHPADLRAVGAAADELGYDRMWVPDQEFMTDPFLLLADLAARTRLDLGLALTSPFSRHPVQIARAMASVVHLDDRERSWVLGLGVGNTNLVLGPLGLRSGATSGRLVTAVDVVRRLMLGETVRPDDSDFVTEPVALQIAPTPCQVFVGSRGPRTLAAAAPVSDGLITESLFTPALVDWVRARSGIAPGTPHVAWQSVILLEPGEPVPESARRFAAMLVRTTTSEVLDLMGVGEDVADRARQGTLDTADLTDDDVRRLVAVGSPGEILERVRAAADAGVTGWSSVFLGLPDEAARTMRRFAREVMKPFRDHRCV